jgi:hypothetical protein
MKSYSITHRLITTVLLVELLAALSISGAAMLYERHVRFRSFDIMLRGRADSLLGAVQDAEDTQDNVMLDGTEVNLPAEDIYQVQDASGRVLGHSPNWTDRSGRLAGREDREVSRVSVGGTHYRALRIEGLRIVDPGDKGGGIPRRVSIFYGSPIDRVWRDIWEAVGFYAASRAWLCSRFQDVDFLASESRPGSFARAGGGSSRRLGGFLELRSSPTCAHDQGACTPHRRAGDGAHRSGALVYAATPICRRCRARAQDRGRRAEVFAATAHAEATDSARV